VCPCLFAINVDPMWSFLVMASSQKKEAELAKLTALLDKKETQLEIYKERFRRFLFLPFLVQLLQLSDLRKAFNVMKKKAVAEIEENCVEDHSDFQASLIIYLLKISPQTSTDDICNWIEVSRFIYKTY
jgi:hypothetical protein